MARPSPVPLFLVVKWGKNNFSRSADEIPAPLSENPILIKFHSSKIFV